MNNGTCICKKGFTGEICDICIVGYHGSDCDKCSHGFHMANEVCKGK